MNRGGRDPFKGPMRTSPATWAKAAVWNRKAEKAGERRRVFTCSMSDFLHQSADPWRPDAWQVIKDCWWLDFLILTKRIELIKNRLPDDWETGYPNVWLGVSLERQEYAARLDHLCSAPAAVRFVSAEPLLGKLDIGYWLPHIDWVIAGGESGGNRRPSELSWYQSLYDQCQRFDTRFYMKQDTSFRDGEQGRIPDDLWAIKEFPEAELITE